VKEYSEIPESQRSPYVTNALKNCHEAITMLDEAIVFQDKYKKFLSGTYATENISSLGEFHEQINSHKLLLTELFDTYTKTANSDIKARIQTEIKMLIKYMHSTDFHNKNNEFAYVYEIYMTYRDFIRPLKL